MKITRSGAHALALCIVAVAACSERPTAPELGTSGEGPPPSAASVFAQASPADPTAIPIGAPARVELWGTVAATRRTLTFPLPPAPGDYEKIVAEARDWFAGKTAMGDRGIDGPRYRRLAETAERLLAARSPEEIRAALGPDRDRVTEVRTIRPIGPGMIEHTSTYQIDGRRLLQVVTPAGTKGPRALLSPDGSDGSCVDDPYGTLVTFELMCGYDPYFDPQPVVADVAVLHHGVDAAVADIATLEFETANRSGCEIERAAYWTTLGLLAWKTGETAFWAWARVVPKAYLGLKESAGAGAAFYAAFLAYKECLRGLRGG